MNIHEYQATALLAKFAVPLLNGGVAYTQDEATPPLSNGTANLASKALA